MKILFITQSNGGVESFLNILFKDKSISKDECFLIAPFQYSPKKYEHIVKGFSHVNMCRNLNPVSDIKAIFRLRALVKHYSPDIVFLQSSKAGGLGRIACLGLHKTILYNPHGWAFNMGISDWKRHFYIVLERLLAHITDKIVVISDREKESALQNHIAPTKKIKVIYNGVDISGIKARVALNIVNRKSLHIPENAFIVGMVGRITKQKSPDTFVRTAFLIKKHIPNAFFLMVGDGEERPEIERLVNSYGFSDICKITGWVEHPVDYESLFDVALLLSRWEGFGLVLAEYMVLKKPIVATDVDAIPNLIENNKNGLLVPVDNESKTADSVFKLYSNPLLDSQLVQNGYLSVSNKFNSIRMCNEYYQLFHSYSVLKNKK